MNGKINGGGWIMHGRKLGRKVKMEEENATLLAYLRQSDTDGDVIDSNPRAFRQILRHLKVHLACKTQEKVIVTHRGAREEHKTYTRDERWETRGTRDNISELCITIEMKYNT